MAELKENKGIMYGCLEAGGLFVYFYFCVAVGYG